MMHGKNGLKQLSKYEHLTTEKFSRMHLDSALRERRTTSDHIAAALRAAIYDGQFEDGEELNQVELANHFKVSRVPIREALRRLQAEGLVTDIAHRRAVVIGLSLPEIIEFVEIRAVLEGYLVEKAGPLLQSEDIEALEKLCHEMERIKSYDHDWVQKNWEFHRLLYRRAEASAAVDMVEQMHLKVERYVRRAGRKERLEQAAREHLEILDDIKRGEYEAARTHLQTHILHSRDEICAYYEQ